MKKSRTTQDLNNTNWSNGFFIQFRQSFTKETFSYDECLKSQNIQYSISYIHSVSWVPNISLISSISGVSFPNLQYYRVIFSNLYFTHLLVSRTCYSQCIMCSKYLIDFKYLRGFISKYIVLQVYLFQLVFYASISISYLLFISLDKKSVWFQNQGFMERAGTCYLSIDKKLFK